jgi:hypothetical protein
MQSIVFTDATIALIKESLRAHRRELQNDLLVPMAPDTRKKKVAKIKDIKNLLEAIERF